MERQQRVATPSERKCVALAWANREKRRRTALIKGLRFYLTKAGRRPIFATLSKVRRTVICTRQKNQIVGSGVFRKTNKTALAPFNPLNPTVACCHMGTTKKHPVSDRVKPSFVIIFDIQCPDVSYK